MMKLTLTLALGSAISSNGFGVASGSGGAEASQFMLAVACNIAANFESCSAEAQIWRSRVVNPKDGPDPVRNPRPLAEARQLVETKASRRSARNWRNGMSNSQERGGLRKSPHSEPALLNRNPHASEDSAHTIEYKGFICPAILAQAAEVKIIAASRIGRRREPSFTQRPYSRKRPSL